MVPLCDLTQQYAHLRFELDAAIREVCTGGRYILGPNVAQLESEVAAVCATDYACGVNSGTDALHLALRALGIGPGDEVITTPFTFVATTEAIGMVGAVPVFVDIEPDTYNIDVGQIASAVTPRTRAILPVHLYGQPCNMDAIMQIAAQHELHVVEDCAQAIGATWRGRPVGSFGNAGCLSFFPSKNLGCFGDGGMLVSNDSAVYEGAEMLRRHGGKVKYHHSELGLNSRLDELQAAILRVKLPHLSGWSAARRRLAYRYNRLFREAKVADRVTLPRERAEAGGALLPIEGGPRSSLVSSVYHQYTIQVDDRSAVMKHLKGADIGCAIYYPIPLHLQEVHADLGYRRGQLPVSERAAERCLSLPIFPEMTESQQDQVVAAVVESLGRRSARAA